MTMIQSAPMMICPFCSGTSFTTETKGLISKTTTSVCLGCGSVLESQDNQTFAVVKVPDAYSNTAPYMQGRQLSRDKLRDPDLPIRSDEDLADIANATGDLFERILVEADQNVPIILRKSERAVFVLPNVSLLEERSRRVPGGLGSFSFRIVKGVWYHTGRLSQPQYASALTTLDSGVLVLTTARYLFVGRARSIDQALTKITSVRPFNDGIGIARTNKQKLEYYQGSYHWPMMSSIFMGVLRRFANQSSNQA